MEQILIDLITKYPVVLSVVSVVGILRLIMKPLFVFFKEVVDATPTRLDNEFLDKVMQSKIYSMVAFLLDYLGSIKLPEKK